MIFLYRTMESDNDGDPMDHGIARAKTPKKAAQLVSARLKKVGALGTFRLYPQLPPKGDGVFTDADAGELFEFDPAFGILTFVKTGSAS